ncbi:hypothetical protein DERF_006557 [Dermatophagoides farinae]|uniref:Peptidase A2 domain-containing protein n=1 Tax=Dermatophagoides farinae TaxID=6954 RepID=A0A922IAK5_DERFA|nr:hypothetical protein DERF_006557 [Dermatophagoides farinae]
MDDKKKQRTNLRNKVTKKHGEAGLNLLDRNETTKAKIINLIKDLNTVETELLEVDFDEEKFESYNRKCQFLINYFSVTTTTTTMTSTTTSNMERTIKYQRRALPTFDVDEKFFALKSMLKGEPLRLVANLLETEVNYERAKNILKERYQDKQRISNIIIDRIKMLPMINVNDLDEMQKTVIEEIIRPTILSKWYSPEAARHGSTCSGLIDFFVQDVKIHIRNRDLLTTNQVNQVSIRPSCIFCRQNHKPIYLIIKAVNVNQIIRARNVENVIHWLFVPTTPPDLQKTLLLRPFQKTAFIDTGAEITCISKNLFDQLKLQIIKNSIINIRQLDNLTQSLGRVKINLQIGRITRFVEAHVVRNLTTNLLLGLDNSQLFDLNLDLNDNCLKQRDKIVNNVQHSSNQPCQPCQ